MSESTTAFEPDARELAQIYEVKYFRFGEPGWGPRMRRSFGYFTPDDYYEALVAKLVVPGCDWADIGCGRDIFPQHPDLARALVQRAHFVFGIDPDANVLENPFVTDRYHGMVEDCDTSHRFDVVTMRMVAEHIVNPEQVLARISGLLRPGGHLIIYTPYKWAPMSIMASLVPFRLHHPLKRLIWDAQARDTFPTAYRLNTRPDLARLTTGAGLEERYFSLLDDCRVLSRYRVLNWLELLFRKALSSVGLRYPEKCILAVYRRL